MRLRGVLCAVSACGALLVGACGGEDTGESPASTGETTRSEGRHSASAPPGTPETSPAPKVFDPDTMRRSVRTVLTDDYGIEQVESVRCPAGQPVRAEATFNCLAVINDRTQQVPITVIDDQGRYEVGHPEDPVRTS